MQNYSLVDLIIIGAQKSFTTSLKTYLGEHPDVITHPQQEMTFYLNENEYNLGYERALLHYYRGLEEAKGKKIIAKSALLYAGEENIKRLYQHNPNAKLLLTIRNPVDRAYSAYLMEYNYDDVEFPFEDIKTIVEKADPNYFPFNLFVDAGNYAKHLKNVYKYFPKEQVMVVLSEEIKENPLDVCQQVFKWLGIDDTFKPHIKVYNPTMKRGSRLYARFALRILKQRGLRKIAAIVLPNYYNHKFGNVIRGLNKTNHKYPPMDKATRDYLLSYYRKGNQELEELTGKKVTTLWNK